MQPGTKVDLVVYFGRSRREGSLHVQRVGPKQGRPYTIGRMSGRTAAEIESSMARVRQVGIVVRSVRVVGDYGSLKKQQQGEARRRIADACLVDLEAGRVLAVTRLLGEMPPKRITVNFSSNRKWEATGAEPPYQVLFIEGKT